MTRIGLSFVLRSRTRQTAKIAAMAQFVSASVTASPAQTAFVRIRTPAEAIMATTAERGCQRTGYARKPCPDKRGRVDRNRAGGHFRDGDKIGELLQTEPAALL